MLPRTRKTPHVPTTNSVSSLASRPFVTSLASIPENPVEASVPLFLHDFDSERSLGEYGYRRSPDLLKRPLSSTITSPLTQKTHLSIPASSPSLATRLTRRLRPAKSFRNDRTKVAESIVHTSKQFKKGGRRSGKMTNSNVTNGTCGGGCKCGKCLLRYQVAAQLLATDI